ncbi:glycosyltransferase [Candidatus Falkowbacteria bacterium]|nr:glycosyltransferase [Candidatus Falkowbacteria bacterium]
MTKAKAPCIMYVSTFPPRECGIATFTQDLTNAIDREFAPEIKSKIVAMNKNGTSLYNYPPKTAVQINDDDLEDYIVAANEINNSSEIKLVNIQHEYGIYGGEWGEFILPFMELIKKPIVLTMHTVLPNPDDWDEREKLIKITQKIAEKAERIVVMTNSASKLLQTLYNVPAEKIVVIPHGVHHIAFPSKTKSKKKLNLEGRTVLSTFGMLNRDKGIEYAIEALPKIVAKHPSVVYLVLGATHPVVRKEEGEVYRNKLVNLVKKLQLEDHVKFYDKYLSLDELIDFLKATDIYVSPTLNPLQAVSGTISYALSCACPIVATANQYAKDVINHERGVLVKFKSAKSIEKALFEVLEDEKMRKEMKKNAYFYSRHMTWQNVALSYFKTFNEQAKIVPREQGKLPPVNLGQIKVLTDKFGMIQFATHTKPDLTSGYCLDDNTRAMLAFLMLYRKNASKESLEYITRYLDFIDFVQQPSGKFYNFVAYNRTIIDKSESEDSVGRAIWSLGYLVSTKGLPEEIKKRACKILLKTLKLLPELKSYRAISFSIIGLYYAKQNYYCAGSKGEAQITNTIKRLSEVLLNQYKRQMKNPVNQEKKWFWFEDFLTYSNFKLSEALFRAYQVTGNDEYLKTAEETIDFLDKVSFEFDYFSAIGQDGWYHRDGKRSYFDQQPEDASSAVEALVAAFEVTKKQEYAIKAGLAFDWFLGKNHLNQMIYDEATGGCYDGMGKESINFNQGAESTISYLLARLTVEKVK